MMITWITPIPCWESRSARTKKSASSARLGRELATSGGCVAPLQLTQEAQEDAGHSSAIDRIREKASRRLRRFCTGFSDEQFEKLVHDVTRSEFVHGFNGAEKESRIRLFETFYRVVD